MTSVHRFDRSLASLRKILAEKVKPQGAQQKGRMSVSAAAQNNIERTEQLKERIRNRLSGLDLGLPEHQERAAMVFLETVLAHEFGSHFLEDPKFHQLLLDVRQGMLTHERTHKDLLGLLGELKDSV